jgi:hypothetical protein
MSSNMMLILSFSIVLNSVGGFHSLQGQYQGFGFRFRFLCLNPCSLPFVGINTRIRLWNYLQLKSKP